MRGLVIAVVWALGALLAPVAAQAQYGAVAYNFSDGGGGIALNQPTEEGDKVASTIEFLRKRGHIFEGRLSPPKGAPVDDYEDREQTLFRATAFGDDVDRPLKKSDGSYTYFASDIAYHKSKIDRGFTSMNQF